VEMQEGSPGAGTLKYDRDNNNSQLNLHINLCDDLQMNGKFME
jgi:hypothetical protein